MLIIGMLTAELGGLDLLILSSGTGDTCAGIGIAGAKFIGQIKDMKKIVIGTVGDVILRELMDSDLEKLALLANNEKVSINLRDGFPNSYTIDCAKSFKKMVDSQSPKTFFAIEYQNDYAGIISLSLGTDVYRKSAEIGYFIGEPFWNKGIVTKAVNLITEWGFSQLDIVRIYTGVFEYNYASQRVLEKCGFVKEAVFNQAICKNDKMYNEIKYAKIRNK